MPDPNRGHMIEYLLAAEFALLWSVATLTLDAWALAMLAGWNAQEFGTGHLVLFALIPFNIAMVGLWVMIGHHVRNARSPTGCARVRETATGWEVRLPNWDGPIAAALLLFALPIPGAAILRLAFAGAALAWASVIATPVVLVVAYAAYRRRVYRPVLIVDDLNRTVILPKGRDEPSEEVARAAIVGIAVIEVTRLDDGAEVVERYDVSLSLEDDAGARSAVLPGCGRQELVERFAAWLRERLHQPEARARV
jgi:hypothetical protein